MTEASSISRTVVASATRLSQTADAHARPRVRDRPLRPDNERILKREHAAKAYALRVVGVSPWDTCCQLPTFFVLEALGVCWGLSTS